MKSLTYQDNHKTKDSLELKKSQTRCLTELGDSGHNTTGQTYIYPSSKFS